MAETIKAVNHSNSVLMTGLQIAREPKNPSRWRPAAPVVSISNGAWHTNGKTDNRKYEFSPEFKNSVQNSYFAEVGVMDFRDEKAADNINGWVAQKTNDLIKQIIDADALSPMLWVLINATYFEGNWANSFNVVKAAAPTFTALDGAKVKADQITSQDFFAYAKDSEKEMIELPFADSSKSKAKYAFVVVLPKQGSDFQALVTKSIFQEGYWKAVSASLAADESVKYGNVTLPKFAFDYTVELTAEASITKAMGLSYLFKDEAQFGNMATKESLPSKIGLIKQSTRIELDEKGVKAAAVTLIGGIESASMPPRPVFNMVVDRPFAYAIVEKTSGTILFLGSVVNPAAK